MTTGFLFQKESHEKKTLSKTYHLLTTKLSHSAVSMCLRALLLCTSCSWYFTCSSVKCKTLPHQTTNVNAISRNTQINVNSIDPSTYATAMMAETNMYKMICWFSLAVFANFSCSVTLAVINSSVDKEFAASKLDIFFAASELIFHNFFQSIIVADIIEMCLGVT